MRHSGMSVNAYADLDGTPAFLFQTSDKIIVIVVDDGNYYTKIWTKAEFGFGISAVISAVRIRSKRAFRDLRSAL
jgi:hypothetical protein